jgi:hypothetical protein
MLGTKGGKQLVLEVLYTFNRLLDFDWSSYESSSIGFENIYLTIEQLNGIDHLTNLISCQNEEISGTAKALFDKFFNQDTDLNSEEEGSGSKISSAVKSRKGDSLFSQ